MASGPGENEVTERGCLSVTLPHPGQTFLPPISLFPSLGPGPICHTAEMIYFSCGLALSGVREQHVITLSKYYNSTES